MDRRRATLALLLAVPAALGTTMVGLGLARSSAAMLAGGVVLVVLPFLALRRLNDR